jgi:hypothetical protein
MTTDPESILQLGIEAARNGDQDEARNLFRLLTREDAQNVQAWLWLAAVAETPDERQASLERVVELDPSNRMARQGLQQLKDGTDEEFEEESARQVEQLVSSNQPAPTTPAPSNSSAARPDDQDDMEDDMGFDDPFAELDSLSDVFSEDPQAVRREEVKSKEKTEASQAAGTMRADDTETSMSSKKAMQGKQSGATKKGGGALDILGSFKKKAGKKDEPAEGKTSPLTGQLRLILTAVTGVLLVLLLVFFVWPAISSALFGGDEQQTAGTTQEATAPGTDPAASVPGDEAANGEQGQPAEGQPAEGQPAEGQPAEGQPGQPDEQQPPAEGQTPPEGQPAQPEGEQPPAEPQSAPQQAEIIQPNTPLEKDNWDYNFPNEAFAVPIGSSIGGIQPSGRFIHILVFVANRTGQNQPVPNDFFVLRDAQGRTYNVLPEVSRAFVNPGVNADRSLMDPIPSNGATTSVALFFDVPLDATNLFLHANGASQGWLVMERVQ